jgi:hypothetical protein
MGHFKLDPADNILRQNFPQNPQQDERLTDAEDLAVARIAERFAPDARPLETPSQGKFDQPAQRPILSLRLRALVTVLIIVALLPSLIFGTMLWIGLVSPRLRTTATLDGGALPSIQSASVTGMPVPLGHKLESVLPVALAAPAILEAKAGGDIPFALALSRTEGLPVRSVIAIHGLPPGSTLSSGRPYGEGGWNLRPEEITGLRLTLPEDAKGEATLEITLVTPGGEDVASAEALLKIASKEDASEAVAVHSDDKPRLNQGVRSFVPDAIESDGSEAMLALETTDVFIASRGSPTAEPPQSPTAEQPQESTLNAAAAKPANDKAVEVQVATNLPARHLEDNVDSRITLSEFVNLREGPSSSRRVIGVINKGSKLRVIGRKRAWLKVTDVSSSQTGWIYSRYAYSARKTRRVMQEATASRLGSSISEPEADSSFLTKFERWVAGP